MCMVTYKRTLSSNVLLKVKKPSLMGAEVNHLCPVNEKTAPLPILAGSTGLATVVLARTSDPPWRKNYTGQQRQAQPEDLFLRHAHADSCSVFFRYWQLWHVINAVAEREQTMNAKHATCRVS